MFLVYLDPRSSQKSVGMPFEGIWEKISLAGWLCRVAGRCVELYEIWFGPLDSDGDFT